MAYTSDDLVADVIVKAALPENGQQISNAEILRLATEKMTSLCIPELKRIRQDFYRRTDIVPCVANQATYVIPPRAIGSTVAMLMAQDQNNSVWEIPYIDPTQLGFYSLQPAQLGPQTVYYIERDRVVLVPPPSDALGSLRMSYYVRPGRLVPVADCAVAQMINTTTGAIVATNVPTSFSAGGLYVDTVSSQPNFTTGFIRTQPSAVTTGPVGGMTFNVASVDINMLSTGDYISITDTTCVIQLPVEMQGMLVNATVVAVLEAIGDQQAVGIANAVYEQERAAVMPSLVQRIDGETKKIVNRSGLLRTSYPSNRRWW